MFLFSLSSWRYGVSFIGKANLIIDYYG